MTPAARPYAEALFSALKEGGDASAALAELDDIVRSLGENPQARAILVHPGVAPQAAEALLKALAEGRSPLVGNLLRVLFSKGRIGLLGDIATALRSRVDVAEGRVRARLQTARPADGAQTEAVAAALGRRFGREVELSAEVRPELIGGARVVVGDRVLDGSLSGQLAALRRHLVVAGG